MGQAPEVIKRKGIKKEADYWSFGILIFEMLVGHTPFRSASDEPYRIYQQAQQGRFVIPEALRLSESAKDLIRKLIVVDPSARLGSRAISDIRSHKWFSSIDWEALLAKQIVSPLIPKVAFSTKQNPLFKRQEVRPQCDLSFPKEMCEGWSWIQTNGKEEG